MRKSAAVEPVGNALSFDVLLAHTSHNLGDIQIGSLGAGGDHIINVIAVSEVLKSCIACILEDVIQFIVEMEFKGLEHILSELPFQFVLLQSQLHFISDEMLGPLEILSDCVNAFIVGEDITASDGEPIRNQPVINH